MNRTMNVIWIIILIIMGIIFNSVLDERDKTIEKMVNDLDNTGHLLTIQIKENQLVYNELVEMISQNAKLNNLDESDPRVLIKMACEIYDLDYTLVVSIARLETANFTSDIYLENNNVGGMRGEDGWAVYSSLIEGVNEYIINLKDNYINQGLTTPESIQPKYCPTKDGKINWAKQVRIIMLEEM